MTEHTDDLAVLRNASDAADWRAALEEIAEERGYFDALDARHTALLTDAGPVLLVTFEEAGAIRESRESRAPLGWDLIRDTGWSSLVLLSEGRSWFRDPAIYAYFDRLVDDGFFDEFERVVFFGAGPAGYAAAAYSVAAPGATLIAVQPQATLAPDRGQWDRRFPEARRLDFTRRYGYAPDMIEAADAAFVIYDPAIAEDAMHASLFALAGAVPVRARRFGIMLPGLLEQTGALARIIAAAGDGELTTTAIHRALRARRDSPTWLRGMLAGLEEAGRPRLVAALCRSVVARKRAPRFRKALEQAEREIAALEAGAPLTATESGSTRTPDDAPTPTNALTSINAPAPLLS